MKEVLYRSSQAKIVRSCKVAKHIAELVAKGRSRAIELYSLFSKAFVIVYIGLIIVMPICEA